MTFLPLFGQSYTDELHQMLATAKHPLTVTLLKDAIAKATRKGMSASAQNGSVTILDGDTVSQQPVTRSVRLEGEKSVTPTSKISSYGKRTMALVPV